jgi:hypothetical protein
MGDERGYRNGESPLRCSPKQAHKRAAHQGCPAHFAEVQLCLACFSVWPVWTPESSSEGADDLLSDSAVDEQDDSAR